MSRSEAGSSPRPPSFSTWAWALGVAAVAIASQWPAINVGFLDGDDGLNFLENLDYRGIGLKPLGWAWQATLLGVYQPVAWMLLEAEHAGWGLNPKGYHATSLALHGLVAALLYVLTLELLDRADPGRRPLHRMASAIAAALFAAHPLRSEVVAWASCQPYLPCSALAILATLAHLKAHDDSKTPAGRRTWAAGSVALYALAVLSKPAIVALPAALLAIDAYPLRRFATRRGAFGAILEKLPHAAVAVGASAIAVGSRRAVNGPWFPLGFRLEQASLGAWFYPLKSLWPVGLSAFYGFPEKPDSPGILFVAASAALVASGVLAIVAARRWPGASAAWLAYLGLLVPCAGLVPMGRAMLADRYAQLATMALVPALAYAISRGLAGRRSMAVLVVTPVALLALTGASWDRCATWRDPEALWAEAVQFGGGRLTDARIALGTELAKRGRLHDAETQFAEAARLDPGSARARNNLGTILLQRGHAKAAAGVFADAARISPTMAVARSNLGVALARLGKDQESLAELREAVRLEPGSADCRAALAESLLRLGRKSDALVQIEAALRASPDHRASKRLLKSAKTVSNRFGVEIEG